MLKKNIFLGGLISLLSICAVNAQNISVSNLGGKIKIKNFTDNSGKLIAQDTIVYLNLQEIDIPKHSKPMPEAYKEISEQIYAIKDDEKHKNTTKQ